jgi:cytochrome c553
MKTDPNRLAWLSVLAAATALAACGRKEEPAAPAAAPAASAPAAAAPAGPVIPPTQVAAPTEAQRATGAELAAKGAGSIAACSTCHGAAGEGQAATGFPRLAGQASAYLRHELESYADGTRKNPVMEPIAKAMTPEQRAATAIYYASLPPDAAPVPSGLAVPARDRAGVLATVGDSAKGVQACANCHGPGGIGSGDLNPYLAGQHPGYLSAALGAWRDGTRNNDPSGQMPVIARSLAPDDVAALSAYYGALPPRSKPMDAERMAAPASASAPAVSSGPRTEAAGAGASTAPAAAAGGAGITQGSGTTGGAQGPGGGGGTGPTSTGNPAAAPSAPAASGVR